MEEGEQDERNDTERRCLVPATTQTYTCSSFLLASHDKHEFWCIPAYFGFCTQTKARIASGDAEYEVRPGKFWKLVEYVDQRESTSSFLVYLCSCPADLRWKIGIVIRFNFSSTRISLFSRRARRRPFVRSHTNIGVRRQAGGCQVHDAPCVRAAHRSIPARVGSTHRIDRREKCAGAAGERRFT
jgi:hypothetical protein